MPTVNVSDTGGHTWTLKRGSFNASDDGALVYEAPDPAGGTTKVSVNLAGYGGGYSELLDLRVLDNTATSQTGAGSSAALGSGTGLWHPITTTTAGSWVLMAGNANHTEASSTPLSGTTTLHTFNDATHGTDSITGKQTNPTGTPGTENIGWNLPTSTQLSFAAMEILPSTSCGGGGGTHFMDFAPSSQCPNGSGSGCATSPNTYPLNGTTCANTIVPDTTERIAENVTQNATKGPTTIAAANYGPFTDNSGEPQMQRDIQAANGQYTGTTDDILEWAACTEGWNENWARAESVVESSWQQSEGGDTANGCAHSYGILQVRDNGSVCPPNHDGWGGYPLTHTSTAFAAQMQMSYLRACFDGSIDYLYPGGQTVAQIAAANGGGTNPTGAGWQFVAWGCVGSWFSGEWGWNNDGSGGPQYIAAVQSALSNQSWNGLS